MIDETMTSMIKGILTNAYMNFKEIKIDDIMFSPFVHLKCMNCGMYKRNYHCIAPSWRKSKERLATYNRFIIIYKRIDNTKRIEDLKKKVEAGEYKMNDYNIKKFACNANQSIVYSEIKKVLLKIAERYPDSNKVKLLGAGGGCRSCKHCGLIMDSLGEKKEPCRNPKSTFTSPEGIGIDVFGTLQKAKINFEIIPQITLTNVGLIAIKENIFTKEDLRKVYDSLVEAVDITTKETIKKLTKENVDKKKEKPIEIKKTSEVKIKEIKKVENATAKIYESKDEDWNWLDDIKQKELEIPKILTRQEKALLLKRKALKNKKKEKKIDLKQTEITSYKED